MLEMLCTDYIDPGTLWGVGSVPSGPLSAAGQGLMSDPSGSDPSGARESAREAAKTIADQIAPLLKRARVKGFDFLAYLLAMALKESRRLSEEQGDGP